MWWVSCAFGQQPRGMPDLDAQHFRPSLDGDGLLWADDGGRRAERVLHSRVLLGYTGAPLVDEDVELLSDVWEADLLGGVQEGRVRIGLRIPIVLLARGDVEPDDGGLGDLQADGKLSLTGDDAPLDLATSFRLTLPTNTLDVALGSRRPGMEVAAIGSKRFGGLLVAANLGISEVAPAELAGETVGSAIVVRSAVGYSGPSAGGALELAGSAPIGESRGPGPWEVLLDGHAALDPKLAIHAGVGRGLDRGIGSPDLRVIVGLGYDSPMTPDWAPIPGQ